MPAITEARKGDATDQHGNVYWHLKLDDGKQAWMLRKPDSPEPNGEVVLSQDSKGGWRAKLPPKDQQGGGKSYEADPKKLRREAAGSALNAAKDLAVAGKIDVTEIGAWTKKFYEFEAECAGISEGEA